MSVDFEAIRKQEWPVLEQMVFLDAACVSFAPQRTVRAVKAFADMTATQEEENSSAHHIAMDSLRGKAYDEAAKLLNADPEEIALVEINPELTVEQVQAATEATLIVSPDLKPMC